MAKTIAAELKASLQLLQVITGSLRVSPRLEISGLNPDIPIQRLRGNFVTKVSQMLETDDLLILSAGTHPDILGLPAVGVEPEAIARSYTKISMLVVHFPRNRAISIRLRTRD